MVFSNLFFLYIFLPANLLCYHLSKNNGYRNAILIGFSLFFYAWGEPVWILLLLFSATIDYFHGLLVQRYWGTPWAKIGVISSLVLNLGLLFLFKYSGFVVESINSLFGLTLPVPGFTLPIGISFYTFQTISYVIDVYRGEVRAQKSYTSFLMYVSLYFQLVAGPIVRYKDVAQEINSRHITIEDFSRGLSRMLVGLSKKVVLANMAGQLASLYLESDLSTLSVAGAWFGAAMYTLQIYFDFSGYSDMAIGLGRMFGFHFAENFNYPYISQSVTEFWRRWHISLGSFFRDYLYIPLGGNRRHLYRNLLIVWFATGLWHGASWNFILWGLFYGLFILLEKLFLRQLLEKIPAFFRHCYLLFLTLVGWVIFYFTDMSRLKQTLSIMFGLSGNPLSDTALQITVVNHIFWIILALLCCLPILPMLKRRAENSESFRPYWDIGRICASIPLLLLCTALLAGQSYNPFLYFRF